MSKPLPTIDPTPPDIIPLLPLEDRIRLKREELLKAQASIREQLMGIGNQLYILDQLLNPQPTVPQEASSEGEPAIPPPTEPGTI